MIPINLSINCVETSARVDPRTSLADFMREELNLTGTHLGCEQGVCGACTVIVDGQPMRSCIRPAVAFDGAHITTIEGFDEDFLMGTLREAFNKNHALQCGFCTTGMMVTARDIVLRIPDADENRIRRELSGNVCRCTGYVGIVKAIEEVLGARRAMGLDYPQADPIYAAAQATKTVEKAEIKSEASPEPTATPTIMEPHGLAMTEFEQSFTVDFPCTSVLQFFDDLERVVPCIPGATLLQPPRDGYLKGQIMVKLGPMTARFSGEAQNTIDHDNFSGELIGKGLDSGSISQAFAKVRYQLHEADTSATSVNIIVAYALTGPLSQFSRGGIVKAVAGNLTKAFVRNLEQELSGGGRIADSADVLPGNINIVSLVISTLWGKICSLFLRAK